MSDETFDPWKSLASELGVDPNAAPPPPPPAPTAPSVPTYTPHPAPEPKKAASDWMALASDLGIEVPPEPEAPIKKKDPVAELLGWPAQARAPEPKKPEARDEDDFEEREPWDADDVRGRWGKDEDLDKPLAEDETPPAESRYDRRDDRGGERGDAQVGGNRDDGPPRGRRRRGGRGRGRGRDRDDRVQGERTQGERTQGERTQGERTQGERTQGERVQGERSQGDRSRGERSQGERGESRGRGYRDRDDRRPRDEASRSEEPRLDDDDLDLADDDAPAAEFGEVNDREREPAGEEGQDRKRPRRRGRRRGRGRERSERDDQPRRRAPANTGHSDEPDTVAFGEDLEDIDEVDRRDESIGDEFATVGADEHEIDVHDDEDDDGPRSGGRNSVRDIMTWKEAIGIIVETNMQERARSPRSGGHGGYGGGHGGRGRRGGGRRNG